MFRPVLEAPLLAVPVGLIILQPDLGTALMISFIGVTVMFVAGVPLRVFLLGPFIALVLACAGLYGLLAYSVSRHAGEIGHLPLDGILDAGRLLREARHRSASLYRRIGRCESRCDPTRSCGDQPACR